MGMLSHGVYIAVTMSNATFLDVYFDLPNEEMAELSHKPDLLRDVQSVEDLAERIPSGFATELSDDRLDGFLDDLQEQRLEKITAVILITDQDEVSQNRYEWRRYFMQPYSEDSGVKIAARKPNGRGVTLRVEDFAEAELFPELPEAQPVAEPEVLTEEEAAAELEAFKKQFGISVRKKDEYFLEMLCPKGVVIKRYKGKDAHVVIPAYVGGYKVVEIAGFGKNDYVESVDCPTDVLINDCAFDGCKKLRHEDAEGNVVVAGRLMKVGARTPVMVLPVGIRSVGSNLMSKDLPPFSRDNAIIKELVIPEGVKEIGTSAFQGCWNLEKLTLPTTLERIGRHAFQGCGNLRELVLPEGLRVIEDRAFQGCGNLTVKGISPNTFCGKGAFGGCDPSMAREDGLTCINGVMYDLHLKKHKEYLGLPEEEWSVVIPKDVHMIAGDIIFNNPGNTLDSLTIHNGLTFMYRHDFFLQGIRKLRLVDRDSGELLMETEAFASCDTVLASTPMFEKFCDLIEKGDYPTLIKKYGGKKAKKK